MKTTYLAIILAKDLVNGSWYSAVRVLSVSILKAFVATAERPAFRFSSPPKQRFLLGMVTTLLGTNISPTKTLLRMLFLSPRLEMFVPWRVFTRCCGHPDIFDYFWFIDLDGSKAGTCRIACSMWCRFKSGLSTYYWKKQLTSYGWWKKSG